MTEAGIERIDVNPEDIVGKVLAEDVVDSATGEVLLKCNEMMSLDALENLFEKGIPECAFIRLEEDMENSSIRDTLLMDHIESTEDAVMEIYRRLRPS